MRNVPFDVEPISGALGAVLHGVDLGLVDEALFAAIEEAWLEHLVLFFVDQDLSPEQQIAVARRFGAIHYHPYMQGLEAYPEILEIVKEPGSSYTFGAEWHSDQMFNPQPAKATMLYAKETPHVGGDTLFANMYLAYEALSDGMRETLDGLRSYCTGTGSRNSHGGRAREDRYADNPAMKAKLKRPDNVVTEAVHPLVRTHPQTGRKSLFIGSHTHSLDGFTEKESQALVSYLRTHSVRPEFTCRFSWQPGSIALWDNRCTQHHAVADYDERRRMHRITVAGDTPYQ